MSEGKARRRLREEVLGANPFCVYCGGVVPATTVVHMPPRIMFRGKHRPKGLEFSACVACNNGSSHADLVAALLGRTYPDAATELEQQEFEKLLRAADNNIPGLLEEMQIGRGGQKLNARRIGVSEDHGFLRVGGPLVSIHMQAFAMKLGLALHFEATKLIVPPCGGVSARWFSNVDKLTGAFPEELSEHLPPTQTLQRGCFGTADQFEYTSPMANDGSFGMHYASFRSSFAIVAFTALDRTKLSHGNISAPHSPLDVGRTLSGGLTARSKSCT